MTAWKEYQKRVVTGWSIGEQPEQMGTQSSVETESM